MFLRLLSIPQMGVFLAVSVIVSGEAFGQNGSRSNALRNAQLRGQQGSTYNTQPTGPENRHPRIAQGSGTREPIIDSMPQSGSSPIVGGPSGTAQGGYLPRHLHVGPGPISSGPIVENGSPILSDDYYEGEYFDEGLGYQSSGGACGDICWNRNGGCGPACWGNCWIHSLSSVFSNAELFAGAHGFRSSNFTAGNQVVDDSSFGFYGGLNLGLPLCPITCGLFSTQIGVRSSQSEFDGDFFSTDNRDQLFVTAGVFRRVDYGLQMGVVGDFLRDEWFTMTDLSQIRGDVGWVYPGGNTIGFRFAIGTSDDETTGIINGTPFTGLLAEVIDNYRFYYRFVGANTGHGDIYAGWTDNSQAVLGLDFDLPVNGIWGLQSGFNYFLPDPGDGTIQTSTRDAWNVYVGFTIRPQGIGWYGNYDRPLFNVADNGSFVFRRN